MHPLPASLSRARRGGATRVSAHGLVEEGTEVAVAGVPCQQVRRAASAEVAAGRADLPPPTTAVSIDHDAVVVVIVVPQEMSTRIRD